MFEQGLVSEVRDLTVKPNTFSHTARQALGYKEVIDWLESFPPAERAKAVEAADNQSDSSIAMLKDTIQTRTRQFAKRQTTWFRNLDECHPINITGTEKPDEIADCIFLHSTARISLSDRVGPFA